MMNQPDAIVIGSGPNGLAAAIVIARAGRKVLVLEAEPTIGGGVRSAELTLPGFMHDICSAVHPLAIASPFFSQLPLQQHGLRWIHPQIPVAHPLDDDAVLLPQPIAQVVQELGEDGEAYRALFTPLLSQWQELKLD